MQLINLITFFRSGGTFEAFCKAQGLDESAEVIEIYAQEPVSLTSQLGFFPIEETDGQIEFEADGSSYQNLFDFFYFLDAIKEVEGNDAMSDEELAERLFTFAQRDA